MFIERDLVITRQLTLPFQDGFDLVSGSWVPRKNPSSALFLVTDARPLITRSVSTLAPRPTVLLN